MYLYFVYFSAVYIESESHLQLSVVLVGIWRTWLVCGTGIDSQSIHAGDCSTSPAKQARVETAFVLAEIGSRWSHFEIQFESCESVPGTT